MTPMQPETSQGIRGSRTARAGRGRGRGRGTRGRVARRGRGGRTRGGLSMEDEDRVLNLQAQKKEQLQVS